MNEVKMHPSTATAIKLTGPWSQKKESPSLKQYTTNKGAAEERLMSHMLPTPDLSKQTHTSPIQVIPYFLSLALSACTGMTTCW